MLPNNIKINLLMLLAMTTSSAFSISKKNLEVAQKVSTAAVVASTLGRSFFPDSNHTRTIITSTIGGRACDIYLQNQNNQIAGNNNKVPLTLTSTDLALRLINTSINSALEKEDLIASIEHIFNAYLTTKQCIKQSNLDNNLPLKNSLLHLTLKLSEKIVSALAHKQYKGDKQRIARRFLRTITNALAYTVITLCANLIDQEDLSDFDRLDLNKMSPDFLMLLTIMAKVRLFSHDDSVKKFFTKAGLALLASSLSGFALKEAVGELIIRCTKNEAPLEISSKQLKETINKVLIS